MSGVPDAAILCDTGHIGIHGGVDGRTDGQSLMMS